MCTVTLSYDKHNAEAREKLAVLLNSGLFTEIDKSDAIDYNDPWLYEDHGDLPPLPEGKDTFTPDEAYEIIMNDIRHIYSENYAI